MYIIGAIKSQVTDSAIGKRDHVFDLAISGDTLIVANFGIYSVLFYSLNRKA